MPTAVKYRVLIEQDEDGAFVATCPSLPGCVSQGATRDGVPVVSGAEAVKAFRKIGYQFDRRHGSRVVLRRISD